jgi:hypothetical protein
MYLAVVFVFDKEGVRHVPRWSDAGGFKSQGIELMTAVFTLDPAELAPGQAA